MWARMASCGGLATRLVGYSWVLGEADSQSAAGFQPAPSPILN
jgi:hypothetical protein